MPKRFTGSETIYLGEEKITGGRKTGSGRLVSPIAKISLRKRNISHTPEPDIGEIIFNVKAFYQEATMKEDLPHFLLEIFDENNKLIGRHEWFPDEDTWYRYDEYEEILSVSVDLKGYEGSEIKLHAHLKCWLEESEWDPRGGGEPTVYAEDNVGISIGVPGIKESKGRLILSFGPVGRAPSEEERNIKEALEYFGRDYKTVALFINQTNNTIKYGDFTIYENNVPEPSFILGGNKIKPGGSTAFVNWFNKTWVWYEVRSGGKLRIIDKADKRFVYKLYYLLRDEYGWEHEGTIKTPRSELTAVISIPEFKFAALDVYNDAFDVKDTGGLWSLIGAAAAAGAVGAAFGPLGIAAGFLGTLLVGLFSDPNAIKDTVEEVQKEMKRLIDDPPAFDRNYKKLVKRKVKKVKLSKPKNKYEKILQKITRSNLSVVANTKALIPTLSRTWTAKVKKDKAVFKRQNKALRKYRGTLAKEFKSLGTNYKKIADEWKKAKVKIRRSDVLVLKNEIKRKGLPKEVKKQLRKKGFSNKRIKKMQKRITEIDLNNIDLAKTYLRFSKNLLRLSKAVKKMKV